VSDPDLQLYVGDWLGDAHAEEKLAAWPSAGQDDGAEHGRRQVTAFVRSRVLVRAERIS
jgi:hypothetical protein